MLRQLQAAVPSGQVQWHITVCPCMHAKATQLRIYARVDNSAWRHCMKGWLPRVCSVHELPKRVHILMAVASGGRRA